MDDKAGVKKLGGWDSLAKKSQSGGLSLDTSVQFELFRKQAKEKEEKRKQLRVEEERKRRLKEQEEKERARDQAAAESAELELKRQNELLRQKEQVLMISQHDLKIYYTFLMLPFCTVDCNSTVPNAHRGTVKVQFELQERRRREAMSTGSNVTSQMDLMLNFEANL
ncbi:unnamed protein product [Gongylonema pulchrum]|uniref:BRD4_CDT domain-containing protein n=1 Tax=Gongylonema pulchrum TaxID=637853 RepID=A0A183D7W0_9BILA|nr:unnamed protein product [Gongylonema pulchrum]